MNENKTQTNTVSGANSGYKENASGARKNKESDSPEAKQHEAEEAAKRGADSSDQAHGRRRKIKILASSSDENKEAARAKVFDQIQQLRVNHSRL